METLEKSRVCRLCGKQAGMSIDIFGKRGNHVKKINTVLPILVHEMDLLPKHMCHPCNYKLQEFHKFYEDCLKTDANLKSQLSWMQGSELREEIIMPMVQINNVKIKSEPLDYEEGEITRTMLGNEPMSQYEFSDKCVRFSGSRCSRCGCYCGNRNYTTECSRGRKNQENEIREIDYPSRDAMRRNLFATEIFGTKNARVQTEIPYFVERPFFSGETPNGVSGPLRRLSGQQDDAVKIKTTEIPVNISSRNLRPRKSLINDLPESKSSNVSNKVTSREIGKEIIGTMNNSKIMEIKVERELDRSLRPRRELINYSESKRKRVLDLDRCKKRIKTSIGSKTNKTEFNLAVKQEIKIEPNSPSLVKPEVYKSRSAGRIRKTKTSSIKKEIKTEIFAQGSEIDNLSLIENQEKSTERRPKRLAKDVRKSTNICLRSQIRYLRNGKLMKFHLDVDGLGQNNKYLQRVPFVSIRRTNLTDLTKNFSTTTASKFHYCSVCDNHFASHELYRLHSCYNNKRH